MEIWTLGVFSIYCNDNVVSCSFSSSVLTLAVPKIRQVPYDCKATNIIYLCLDPRNLLRYKLLLFPGRFCQARIQDRVRGSSPGTGLSRIHRVRGRHQHIWLRISSLRGNSSKGACPRFKRKASSKVAFMIRKERTNHLDQGNRQAPGSLNFSAGDHRFLLLFRRRRGFAVTSHVLCKPKTLALDEFGLLTNYQNFFHPNVGRAYTIAVPKRQHTFSPWFSCQSDKESSKDNSEVHQGFGLVMAFLISSRQHLSSVFPLA